MSTLDDIVSNAASPAILIPPSIPMIIHGWIGETSIAKLLGIAHRFSTDNPTSIDKAS